MRLSQSLYCLCLPFHFVDFPIDVVIPCVEKDLITLDLCIDGIKENGVKIRRVIVVSKNKLTDQVEWFDEAAYPFSLEDVAGHLPHNDLQMHERRKGWYYQQLLKLYAPLVIPDISPNVLILDSDTIFLNPVSFLNEENGGMYNPGNEYNPPYFTHAARLIPGLSRLFPEYSGIAHHMVFQKPVIEDLFHRVESLHSAPFWQVFCQSVEPECLFAGASEYELYFNYVFSRTSQTTIRKLKWKNIQRLSEISSYQAQGLHYVSIHSWNRIED